ncbi:hypothetical protein ACOMHN_026741 [Nucella lapillus]
MFEVASRSGSTSSDSIVNIPSPSGASSISTSPITTTTTAIITTNNNNNTHEDSLKSEVDQLREDKKILEGRIRGYRTLSDLLVSCRKENNHLRAQLESLQLLQVHAMADRVRHTPASSPFSLVSMQAAQQSQTVSTMSQPDVSQLTLQDQTPPSVIPLTSSTHSLDPKGPPVSHPPLSRPSSSLQETVGPPGDSKGTNLICLSSVNGTNPNPAASQESAPRQESLEPGSGQNLIPTSQNGRASHHESLASENSAPELLQPDSDKYDEATYEKIGPQLGLGHAGLSSSMYAAAVSRAESRPIDFPSLSSGMSSGMTQPASHGSVSNPPFMAMSHQSLSGMAMSKAGSDLTSEAMSHQSLSGMAMSKAGSDLASEVENISERLHSEPGDSIAIGVQMHQIAERISTLEQKKRDQQKLIETLMNENQDLKRLLKGGENSHQTEMVVLREQNSRLIQQLKNLCPEERTTALKSPSSQGDWVHVDKPSQTKENPGAADRSFVDRIRTLEQDKAELQRANTNWKNQWDQMEHNQQLKMAELRSKLLLGDQELASLKARLVEQTSEFEGRMLEMKRRIGEEENQKEEAQHQQRLAERQSSELQEHLTEMRTQLSDTAREKQALATELSILKAHATGHETQTSAAAKASRAASHASLEAEIAMLKEQLKVFAEDFEQERMDRTTAQAARDHAKKSAETMARQNQSISSQVKHLQKQIKDRDDTISWTLRQNEGLQRQATDYKKKLASEWDEKQSLQRRVLILEQQLQQQHPARNPYLSADPTTYNPLPVHQPPPPPRNTGPYFGGGQGAGGAAAAAPRNRTVPAVLSPEHLPGAWTCSACTYINYPGRTVCESCGLVNTLRSHPDQFGFASHDMYGSDHALLMSRGADQNQGGMMLGTGDVVADSGP